MNQIYEFRLRNMYKKYNNASPCPTIYAYLKQHFNPKKLPQLITHLMSCHMPQKIQCSKSTNLTLSYPVLNTPSMSVMFSNMKLYDDNQIIRQNSALDKMLKMREKWQQFCGIVEQNNAQNQRDTACTYENDRMTNKTCNNEQDRRKTTEFQTKIQLNLLQILQLSHTAFQILNYRLKDLASFISTLSQLLSTKDYQKALQNQLKNTIYQLYHVCQVILNQIDRLKINIQSCTGVFMDYKDQIVVKAKNIRYVVSNIAINVAKERKNRLYINRNYALYYREKLKQINQKYTKLARQIFTEQALYRKKKQYRTNNVKTEQPECSRFDVDHEEIKFFSGFPDFQCSDRNFGSNMISFRRFQNCHSILKNKNGISKNQKRISIQILTQLLEQQRKSRLKTQKTQNSKFMPRPAITIGSKRKLTKKTIQPGKSTKMLKKQVRIQQFQTQKLKTKQKKIYNKSKNGSPSASPKTNNDIKLSTKKTKLQIFQQLCQRADQQQQDKDKESICSIVKRINYHSWHQKNGYDSEVSSMNMSMVSKICVSKCRTQMNPALSKKAILKLDDFKDRRIFYSCKELKNYKMRRVGKKRNQISESFKEILEQALDKKLNRKKHLEMGSRSGKIIPVGSQDYEQMMNKLEIVKRRNNQSKTKSSKQRHRLGKSKYNQIFEQSTIKPKQSQLQTIEQNDHTYTEQKAVRRVGYTMSSELDDVKTNSSKQPQIQNKSIRRTMGSTGSRKFPISSKKLTNQCFENTRKGYYLRVKTEQNYHIPPEFKVNVESKQNLAKTFVNFYPQIQCSLYKITKRHQRLGYLQNQQNIAQNKMLQFTPLQAKRHNHQSRQSKIQRCIEKKKQFVEENVQFDLSRNMLVSANLLQQKQLCWLGK